MRKTSRSGGGYVLVHLVLCVRWGRLRESCKCKSMLAPQPVSLKWSCSPSVNTLYNARLSVSADFAFRFVLRSSGLTSWHFVRFKLISHSCTVSVYDEYHRANEPFTAQKHQIIKHKLHQLICPQIPILCFTFWFLSLFHSLVFYIHSHLYSQCSVVLVVIQSLAVCGLWHIIMYAITNICTL